MGPDCKGHVRGYGTCAENTYNHCCGEDIAPVCNTHAFVTPSPLASGIDSTLAERGSRYGSFIGHALVSQDLKAAMVRTPRWCELPPDMKESLEMIQHKIARVLNGDPNYVDSWHDIIGYARLIEKRLEGDKE